MISGLSPWQRGTIMDILASGKTFASLHTAAVSWLEPLANEVTGTGYRRIPIRWTRSGLTMYNGDPAIWRGLDVPIGLVAVGLFTTARGNQIRGAGLLPEPVTLLDQTSFRLGRGEIVLSIA